MLSLRRDLFINITGSVVNTFAFMWVLRACGTHLAPASLGLYLLTRRLADSASNLVQAGAPPTLRRYVAMEPSPARQLDYLRSGLMISVIAAFATLMLSAFDPAPLVGWLFGHQTPLPDNALLLTSLFTVSLVFHNLAVSLLSAQGRFVALTAVTFTNTVGWLVLALYLSPNSHSIAPLLGWHAAGTIVAASLVLGVAYMRLARLAGTAKPRTAFAAYFRYGAPRVLSPFFDALLVAAGPWLLRDDLESAAHVAMALMLLRVGQTLVTPAATVIGIAVARAHGAGNAVGAAATLRLTAGVLIALSLGGLAVLWPWLDTLVELWLGATPLAVGVTTCGRGLLFAMVPFTVFQGLKEPIEMLSTKPLNLIATTLALLVLAGATFAFSTGLELAQSVTTSYVIAYTVLAVCALYFLRHHLGELHYYGIAHLLITSASVFALNFVVASAVDKLTLLSRLAVAGTVGLSSLTLATLLLASWRPSALVRECHAAIGTPFRRT